MKKRLLISLFASIMVLFLSIRRVPVTFYIGIANPSERIDIQIEIDGVAVFADTKEYGFFNYSVVEKQLRPGLHKLVVRSEKEDLLQSKTLVLLFSHYIVVEYYPEAVEYDYEKGFLVRNKLTPFWYD